jgi:hypothetical protein
MVAARNISAENMNMLVVSEIQPNKSISFRFPEIKNWVVTITCAEFTIDKDSFFTINSSNSSGVGTQENVMRLGTMIIMNRNMRATGLSNKKGLGPINVTMAI